MAAVPIDALNLSVLAQSSNGAAAFRGLYLLHKSLYKRMSFGYIMRRTGIPSKGYLSHVMNGDRRLNPRYQSALCELFKLEGEAGECMRRLWQQESVRQAPITRSARTVSVSLPTAG